MPPSWRRQRTAIIDAQLTYSDDLIGAIPGAGAAIAAFMAYNEAKRTSRQGHLFGIGVLDVVAAPEAANNAVTGTSLISLFTLGIPGSVVAALLIGAFTMQGMTPGPTLFETQSGLMYAIMIGMVLCNIAMFIEGKYLRDSLLRYPRSLNRCCLLDWPYFVLRAPSLPPT